MKKGLLNANLLPELNLYQNSLPTVKIPIKSIFIENGYILMHSNI